MGVRPDTFDFMTTTPPSIVSKQIVWVNDGNIITNKLLQDIGMFLDNLQAVESEGCDSGEKNEYKFCSQPRYGRFLIIANKMTNLVDDQDLLNEIMHQEPPEVDGAQQRNDVRTKLQECFEKDVSAIGIPRETLEPGQDFDYDVLSERFKDGLEKIVNIVVADMSQTRFVNINCKPMVFNSTNSELIMGMLIDQANSGSSVILNGVEALWSYTQERVRILMEDATESMETSVWNCEPNPLGSMDCTMCVCSYRNGKVSMTVDKALTILEEANSEANVLFGESLSNRINDLIENEVDVWEEVNSCTGLKLKMQTNDCTACDISAMTEWLIQPGEELAINCEQFFLCDDSIFQAKSLVIDTNYIYIEDIDVTIYNVAPTDIPKAPATLGSPGLTGFQGADLTITFDHFLETSSNVVTYKSQGGTGGPGSKGKDANAVLEPQKVPTSPDSAYYFGSQYDHIRETSDHCAGGCERIDEKWYNSYVMSEACNANSGETGGDGGAGGPPGNFFGSDKLVKTVQGLPSSGGAGGPGGNGGAGFEAYLTYKAYKFVAAYF